MIDLSLVYRVRGAGQAALTSLSCLWFRYNTDKKVASKQLHQERSCMMNNQVEGFTVNIHLYWVTLIRNNSTETLLNECGRCLWALIQNVFVRIFMNNKSAGISF